MATAIAPPLAADPAQPTPALLPLFRALGNLKRVRSADQKGSVAGRLFGRGWARLLRGHDLRATALATTAEALAATSLGDLDRAKLRELGLSDHEATEILEAALAEAGERLDPRLCEALAAAIDAPPPPSGSPPGFAAALDRQPRAGVTCPGRGRLIFQPPESHAEHCAIVAIYAVLLAPTYGAAPEEAFLAGMAHHLHNAVMPDSGYAGEVLLGRHLGPVMTRCRDAVLDTFPDPLRGDVLTALDTIADDTAPAAKAFHAADAIDRVLEIEQHVRLNETRMATVLEEFELVHDGPVKPFQDQVLRSVGLA